MTRFLQISLALLLLGAVTAKAQCPTPGASVIEVCNDAGGSGTIRVYFYDGAQPVSYILYDLFTLQPVSPPGGPALVDESIPLPPTAVAGVEFTNVPDGDYTIRVNCAGGGAVFIGGLGGINVNSANALTAGVTVDPDCNPATGGLNADGSITLNISGGTAPYDLEWTTTPPGSPIPPSNNLPAGNHVFANLDGGTYVVEITDASNCVHSVNIDVPLTTMPDAGPDQQVCGSSATLSANAAGPGETGTWTGPAGVTFSPDANTPNAVASNLTPGINTLTWTISDILGSCPGNGDDVDIESFDPPVVDAGSPQTICAGTPIVLAGSIGGGASTATWTTSGDGTFSDASSPTATYTPGAGDISAGTLTLTLTTDDPAGPCAAVSDNVVMTIDPAPTVGAGPDQTICSDGTATLAGSFGGSAGSATWTTAGDGTFSDASALNATYTPGATDIANGTVTLTLTTNDPAGPCIAVADAIVITIDAAATADAGVDQTLCAGQTATLAGVIGGTATTLTWSTLGDGTFDDATAAGAVYTPGTADMAAGTVTLTLTTNDPAGPCSPASDDVILTFNTPPTADAGIDQTICANATVSLSGSFTGATSATWTTSGDGTFDDDTSPTAVYTPGANDIATGTVTLTLTTDDPAGPCVAASDNVTITIDPAPQVSAGAPQTICSGSTVTLGGSIGGVAVSSTWTTSGDGTFDDPASLSAVYTPGATDRATGSVTLTLTTNDPAGPCAAASDNVVITIEPAPTVNAGPDQDMCADATVSLAGSFGGSASAITWATSGDGSFDDNTSTTAVYTPGATDISNGTVTLTLTTDDPAGMCTAVSDDVVITILPPATADAGVDQTICSGATVTLAGSFGGSAGSASWSTAGDGTFDDASSMSAVYTPGAADLLAGMISLTLTTNDPAGPCLAASDVVVITIDGGATVDAGADQTICSDGTATLAGSFGGDASAATWTTAGDGSFDDATALNAIYTPGAMDITNGTVILTLTTDDPAGPCAAASDDVTITIQPEATVDAGPSQTICAGATATLAGLVGGGATTATWSTTGDGSFDDATSLAAVYTPGAGDIASGTVTLTLTTEDPAGPCVASSDNVVITIEPGATADAGTAQTICPGGTATLTGASVGGSATTGAWSIVSQPTGGDGALSDENQTATPASVTFTATVSGDYTLRLTTDDPAGACTPVQDDVVITVSAPATADAGGDQVTCDGIAVTLAGTFTNASGILWTTSGDGTFDDATLVNATYTPGANDASNGTATLTITTTGLCAPATDDMVVTVAPAPVVDAGMPATICSSASVVLNASFGGSATGITWSTGGDGTFDDNTDINATYTPGANDITNGTVTLTATATGSCPGVSDNVVITINPAATVDAGAPQSICVGSGVTLAATFGGSATVITWTTSGDGTFSNTNDPAAVYTPGANDQVNGTVTLTATTDNPAGPCPAVTDNVVITITPVPGDETTPGNESWIGYVYDDSNDATPIPGKIDFASAKYRGFIDAGDMATMSASSSYNTANDVFDLNLAIASPLQGPNVCGAYLDNFSVRYRMDKTFAAGVYRFTVGADDGVRLLIDGVNVLPASAFDFQSYTEYTSDPVCLTAGVHSVEIHYFDNTAQSRLTFAYEAVPAISVVSPVTACVNSAAPALTVSSTDPDVTGFNWYKNGVLVFSGANYTPAASELDMTMTGTTTFQVSAAYVCGETPAADVVVNVVDAATLTISPQTICESGGVVDLRTLVDEAPAGGTFVFSGHANISGNDFDPSGLAGTTVTITVDYSVGSCSAPTGTLSLSITNTATINVPAAPVVVCESAPVVDLTTLVSAAPTGGVFTFTGPQVTGNNFDPAGLSGIQTITVDYTVGCTAPTATFDLDVQSVASITASNTSVCENGLSVDLLTLVSASPSGGTFTFTGAGVTGNVFDPSGQSGTVNINVDYDANGCTDNTTLQITILDPTSAGCVGGNCASVVIIPEPEPATCTNSDGRLVMNIQPFTPAVNNTGVTITISGTSSTGLPISRTIFNANVFDNLPVGQYDYSIEYGDPSCIKTGTFSIDQSGTVGTPVASGIQGPLCFGSATGSLTLDVPGETGNVLEWSLDGGLTDPFKPFVAGERINGIPAGPSPSFQQVISVRRNVTDVCYSSVTVTIQESVSDISATFDIVAATCNGNDGEITNIVASGGNGSPYTYSIDGGASFQSANSFSGLAGGTYTLRVKDGAGCEKDFSATVTFPGFINSQISKSNANCSNGGNSGTISVSITDPGSFEVALSQDQFSPDPASYRTYNNPSIVFTGLPRGEYYVYIRSNGGGCTTRSAAINIFGVYPVQFQPEPVCNGTEMSLALRNVTGEPGVAFDVEVVRKLSTDPPQTFSVPFPLNGEIYLDHDQHAFLQTPAEYSIRLVQFQSEASCNLSSPMEDVTVPSPLTAQVGIVAESYPDIPTGELQLRGFAGGIYPYDVRIELDSASSFSLPSYSTDFEAPDVNSNQELEKVYEDIPAGRYEVQVIDSLGCMLTLVARVPLDEDLFIPNVFTPNGDGSNDVFFIRNLPAESGSNQLVISNRWGKEVFTSDNYQNDWDGTGAADGIYYYRLQVGEGDALTGWIEIIRGPKP